MRTCIALIGAALMAVTALPALAVEELPWGDLVPPVRAGRHPER